MHDAGAALNLLTNEPLELIEAVQSPSTGLRAFITLHSTARGPGFGGCRMRAYASESEAVADAARLAEGMTYKNALARLPFGGGKAVIMQPEQIADRREFFKAFGREVARLDGRYITAEDVGTTSDDMRAVHSVTSYVSGIPRALQFGGDPARFTALGVLHAIQAASYPILGRRSLRGVQIGVQGLGSVGSRLCALLAAEGAELWVSDLDPWRAATVADQCRARVVSNDTLLEMKLEVLAPCAVGGVLDATKIAGLNTRLVAGAANNQLATIEDGDRLHERGIWYLPDFLVNAGGIISVAREYLETGSEDVVRSEVRQIGLRVEELIQVVRHSNVPPARVALAWAKALVLSGSGKAVRIRL